MIFAPPKLMAQQLTAEELARANKSADQFIEEFRRTLDFGAAFEKFSVKNSIHVLKRFGFFKGILQDEKLIRRLDDSTLRRVYVTEMNLYYLVAVHDLAKVINQGSDSYNEQNVLGKPHIIALQEASKRNPLVSGQGLITTKAELERYLKDVNVVVALYRKQLSREDFDSKKYKEGVKRVIDYRKISPSILNPRKGLGLGESTKVYRFAKDLFVFYFIEEKGQLKVLMLVIED
jgi:hypothetical protein